MRVADRVESDLRLGRVGERFQDLRLRQEVLRAAGHHDLGQAARGLDQRLQMLGGPLVGHAEHQFVKGIEQQGDASFAEHVPEGFALEPRQVLAHKVRGDQFVQRMGLFQVAQLDQQRDQAQSRVGFGQLQGERRRAFAGRDRGNVVPTS